MGGCAVSREGAIGEVLTGMADFGNHRGTKGDEGDETKLHASQTRTSLCLHWNGAV